MTKRVRNTEQFIHRATIKHSGKYNYDFVEYKSSKDKVMIVCPKHGEFWQTPSNHLSGFGCMACCIEKRSDGRRLPFENFLAEARSRHGDKYNYDSVVYNDRNSKITVVCPEHGSFEVRLAGHLSGVGCTSCDYLAGRNSGPVKITTAQFVEKARVVHGDTYSYEKTVYKKALEKVVITCPTHGDFEQLPNNHLRGMKCLKCVRELDYHETVDETSLYLFIAQNDTLNQGFLKLGVSVDVPKRMSHLNLQLPDWEVRLLREIRSPSEVAVKFETCVHADKTLHHFWGAGKFGGYTECYWVKELDKINKLIDEFVKTTEGVQEICLSKNH